MIREKYIQLGEKKDGKIVKAENYTIGEFLDLIDNQIEIKLTYRKPSLFDRIFRWKAIQDELADDVRYIQARLDYTWYMQFADIIATIKNDVKGKE